MILLLLSARLFGRRFGMNDAIGFFVGYYVEAH
jgi:hypothetical protein